jgi:serine/threonine-protein kinase
MAVNGDAIKDQLERILTSSEFRRSIKLSNFLRFTVDQALAGEQGSSKECLIGMYIFGRRPDYDPSTDPIVRVEARRLRRKLAAYYANGGRHDPVRIEVPKGAYRPVFESQTSATDREKPSIAVLPFSDRSATHEYESLVDGITLRLIARLAACEDLRVVSSTSVFQYKNLSADARQIGRDLDVELILEGSLRSDAGRFRCDTQLVSTADGKHRWAGSFDCGDLDRFAVEDQFADVIAGGVHAVTMTA